MIRLSSQHAEEQHAPRKHEDHHRRVLNALVTCCIDDDAGEVVCLHSSAAQFRLGRVARQPERYLLSHAFVDGHEDGQQQCHRAD